jgi:hypothetical protein
MSTLELDPALVVTLRALEEHDVEFLLVGEVAEAVHADGGFVTGVAIVPGAYTRNAERLRAALLALDARLLDAGGGEHDLRRADLRALSPCTLQTPHADIEVSFQPPGTGGYRDLFDEAVRVPLAPGVRPLVASPEDLERIARGADVTARRA